MIYFIIIVSLLLFIFMPLDVMMNLGVSTSHLSYSFGYVFLHASWLHLLINCFAMLMIWYPVRRMYSTRYNTNAHYLALTTYLSAVLAGLFCASDIPTVGMSGCVFFLLGVLIILNPTYKQLLNYTWIVLAILIQIYFGKSNTPLHLFAFGEGVVFMCMRELIYQHTNKTGLFGPQ